MSVRTPKPANRSFEGLTTFRGNATRSYYGEGPVPLDPEVRWQHPRAHEALLRVSIVAVDVSEWCGTGWTGQPNVIELAGGAIEVREGAYDRRYHFVDGETGEPVRPPLVTGDLAKGSATSDPDGFPLYYAGSRDGHLRIVALDRAEPETLWSIDAGTTVPRPLRNDDWDGAPLVVRGHLIEGSENGWLYVIRLNRATDDAGARHGRPAGGRDDPRASTTSCSRRSATTRSRSRARSPSARGSCTSRTPAGWCRGGTSRDLLSGGTEVEQVFRFWAGDDVDASIVIDEQGFLYVAAEYQRFNERSREVGQLMKLDPRTPGDPRRVEHRRNRDRLRRRRRKLVDPGALR